MKIFNAAAALGCLALMGALAPGLKADEMNRKTVMTFSGPVEIPGVHLAGWGVLPAGTYVFKIMNSQSDRHIVQIFDKTETTIYATILAIPNFRLKATDKTLVTFHERPAGQPEALRAWFYPGRNWGEEFVYPKARAMELAKDSKTPVLFSSVDMPVEVTEPIRALDADAPVVAELQRAPVMAVQPTGEEVQLAQVVTAPPAEELSAGVAPAAQASSAQSSPAPSSPAPSSSTLPATASQTPLLALFGFLVLGGGLALLTIRRRFAVKP